MKAITLYPEWVAGVVWLGKPVENRGDGRRLHALHKAVGQRVALHAGKQIGGPGGRGGRSDRGCNFLRAVRASAGLDCEVENWDSRAPVLVAGDRRWPVYLSAIYASAVIGQPVTDHPSPWAVPGAWHFPLLDVEVLETPHFGIKGCLGLWDAPEHLDWAQARPAVPVGGAL